MSWPKVNLDDYVLATELADELGMDRGNMRSHTRRGIVKSEKIGGRRFVRKADAKQFAEYYKARRRTASTDV